MKNFSRLSLSAIAAALILAGCGGGGGGSDSTAGNSNSGGTPVSNPGNLSATIEPTTYPAGSSGALMYTQLNDVRQKGGFGTVKQSSSIDTAASNHANYLLTNYTRQGLWNTDGMFDIDPVSGWMYAHAEVMTKPGFTGNIVTDRIIAAGLPKAVGTEVISFDGSTLVDGCTDTLLTSVFHRSALLDPSMRFFGSSVIGVSKYAYTCVINMAWTPSDKGVTPTGWVGVYPGDGQTGLATDFAGEVPDPAPSIPRKGNPASIYVAPGNTLQVMSFTLTDSAGISVPGKVLTVKDSNYLRLNEAYLVPMEPLKRGTRYTVYFAGTNNGANFSRTWGFTTR